MRIIVVVMIFAASMFAQDQPLSLPASCGPEKPGLNVSVGKREPAPAQPVSGQAQIYFIQDNGQQKFGIGVSVTTWIALDGTWVGANKNNSYFSVSVEPGEHHMCSSLRSEVLGQPVEMSHFTVEAGKVYYFRERYVTGGFLFLDAVDSDEAHYLIGYLPQSVSQPKK